MKKAKKKVKKAAKKVAKKRQSTGKFRVAIIESEAGWGQRADEVRRFRTYEAADKFVKEFNSHNTSPTVPSWYMVAQHLSGSGD
jgi:hypothetical protein